MTDGSRDSESVFSGALERAAGTDRAAYLDGACGDDVELRARVEALLTVGKQATNLLFQ